VAQARVVSTLCELLQQRVGVATNAMQTAQKTISAARLRSGRAIVFFSCGKDSIAMLDMVAPVFDEVICVFMYFVPGLAHIERYLKDAETRYKNVKVIQYEHYMTTTIRRNGIFCLPQNVKIGTLSSIDEQARKDTGIPLSFYGSKKNDGMNRRIMLNTYGELPIQQKTQKYYPLADFSNKDVLSYIRTKRLPFPIKYGGKQSNGIMFDLDCYLWMRENEPADLEKMYKAYPLSRKILFDYDYAEKNKAPDIRGEDGTPKPTPKRAVQPKGDKRHAAQGAETKPKKSGIAPASRLERGDRTLGRGAPKN